MTTNRLLTVCLGLAAWSLSLGCAPQPNGTPPSEGSGGSSGTRGSGSATASGGTKGSGGGSGSGGASGSGGSVGSGGTGSGGAIGSGGSSPGEVTGSGGAGSGGVSGQAGGSGSGGVHSGGATGSGAATGSGGHVTTGSGGGTASGGATGSGGVKGSGGTTGSGGSNSNVMHPPAITNGMSGWASRYWDCCKPACGWKANVSRGNPMMSCDKSNNSLGGNYDATNACQGGGTAYMCWSGVPWAADDTLAYGFAAASGGNYSCGRCFQLQFTGTNNNGDKKGTPALNGKTMIVQVINNGGVQATQFDLLIPGGGVGALNACTSQWGAGTDLGSQYGGLLNECNGDVNCTMQKCQAAFSNKSDLMEGCMWFLGWFGGSNNPDFTYQKVACPQALTAKSGLSDPG